MMLTDLQKISALTKIYKGAYANIYKDKIVVTELSCTTASVVHCGDTGLKHVECFSLVLDELNRVNKFIKLADSYTVNITPNESMIVVDIIYNQKALQTYYAAKENQEEALSRLVINNSIYIFHAIDQMYKRVLGYECNTLFYQSENVKDNEEFMRIMGLKAEEGASFLYVGDRDVTTFKSLLPINKPDTVKLEMFDLDGIYFIAKYTIRKKGNIIINKYIKYLHLDRQHVINS